MSESQEKRKALRWTTQQALLAAQCTAIALAYLFAAALTGDFETFVERAGNNVIYAVVFLACWLGAQRAGASVFSMNWRNDLADAFRTILKAVGLGVVCSVFLMVLFAPSEFESNLLAVFSVMALALLFVLETSVRALIWHRQGRGVWRKRALLVGANPRTNEIAAALRRRQGYIIEGALDDDPARGAALEGAGLAYLGALEEFDRVVEQRGIDEVFIGLPVASFYEAIRRIVTQCEKRDVDVRLRADLFELRFARNRSVYVNDLPLLSLTTVPEDQFKLAAKRLMDFVMSSALIIALSPVFLLLAILIKLDSKGPVFFLQERVGQNGRRFKMIKFRSMVANAEELRKDLEDQNEAEGPVFKIRKDPRITRLGAFIRKHSIDEFPQLFNVWMGEMSLVGPRPPIPAEVAEYSWDQRRRLSFKPGMTGLWQVSGRSDVKDFDEWVRLDVAYIDSWSLTLDFSILLRTFQEVIHGRGAA